MVEGLLSGRVYSGARSSRARTTKHQWTEGGGEERGVMCRHGELRGGRRETEPRMSAYEVFCQPPGVQLLRSNVQHGGMMPKAQQ